MARSIWSGAISFGLVNIPVKLFTAVRPKAIRFHMLHGKDGVRVQQKLVCPLEDKEVDRNDVVKGYEVAPDQYVTVKEEELDEMAPEASRAIGITDFVNLKDIDPIYYDKAYYLMPDEGAEKPYKLLLDAMNESGKVAIAKFVMRGKEYLAALRPSEDKILLEVMHFTEEVVPANSIGALPPNIKVNDREVTMAQQLIDSMSGKFKPDKYRDEYTEKVEDLLKKKSQGQKITVQPAPKRQPQVINLIDALKSSLQQAKGPKAAREALKGVQKELTRPRPRRRRTA